MLKHLEGARLGVFIFLGTVFLVLAILLIGNKESLFVDSITVKTYFERVEGLKSGAPVRLSGYDIGSVSDISLASDTSGRVLVVMRIESDLQHFIRLDSEASIATEGLVGKKVVSITPGTPSNEVIKNGGFIKSKTPVNIAAIIEETQDVMAYMRDLTKEFSEIFAKINQGQGTIGKLVNDDELYQSTVQITKSADQSLTNVSDKLNEVSDFIIKLGSGVEGIISNVDSAMSSVRHLVNRVKNGEGALGALIADKSTYDSLKTMVDNLVITSKLAKIGTSRFAENMEALKHNWLFKGYFEQRGYWDKMEYENGIDKKLEKLKKENETLDKKIDELIELKEEIEELKNKK